MGLGRKVWVVGEEMVSPDVNGYLMDQAVMSFASASDRATAIGTPDEAMHAYLRDEDALTVYDGSNWRYVYKTWTSFTPTWNNLILTGTHQWSYAYTSVNVMRVKGFTTLTSTPQWNALPVNVTLPNSETFAGAGRNIGQASYLDSSAALLFAGYSEVFSSGSGIRMLYTRASDNALIGITDTIPFTFTNNDVLYCDIEVGVGGIST